MSEIELKLALPPNELSKAQRVLSPGTARRGQAQRRLTSVYYDTPDLDLRRRNLTLRVRREGQRYIQAVKAEDLTGTDLLRRGEWEDRIDGQQPEPAAPRSGPQLPSSLRFDQLRPIFSTVVERSLQTIEPTRDVKIEVAADHGEIRANGGTELVSELELREGNPAAIYDTALKILECVPVRLETRSKSARGYLLAEGGDARPSARRLGKIELDPKMSSEEALRLIGRRCLATLMANIPAAFADRPEGIHQMRLAARRLRSMLSVMKKMLPRDQYEWASGELRWLSDTAGAARNWDVISERLVKPLVRSVRSDQVDLNALAARVERERRAAYEQTKSELRSLRFTRAVIVLARWFEAREWRNQPVGGNSARLAASVKGIASD
ncbi:MAG: CHAD domain-containing protein, partial [Stellaceae bacterium]